MISSTMVPFVVSLLLAPLLTGAIWSNDGKQSVVPTAILKMQHEMQHAASIAFETNSTGGRDLKVDEDSRGILSGGLTSYRHPFRAQLIKILSATAKALSDHAQFSWYITAGTLLAQERSGGKYFIPWDADVDFATTATTAEMEALRGAMNPELHSAGLSIELQGIYRVVPFVNGIATHYSKCIGRYVDLYQYSGVGSGHLSNPENGDQLSESDVLPTKACSMVDIEVHCPQNVNALLNWRYGENWKEPDHKWVGSVAQDGLSGNGRWVSVSPAQGHAIGSTTAAG